MQFEEILNMLLAVSGHLRGILQTPQCPPCTKMKLLHQIELGAEALSRGRRVVIKIWFLSDVRLSLLYLRVVEDQRSRKMTIIYGRKTD